MKLKPLGANRNVVSFDDGTEILFSYATPVAGFIPGIGYVRTEKKWSVTTSKHINQYLPQSGKQTFRSQAFFDELTATRKGAA